MWKDNDELKDYREGIVKSFGETVSECVADGADIGEKIGSIFGRTGERIGRAIGGVAGAVVGDGVEKDKIHKKKLIDLLYKTYTLDGNTYGLIDMVLVIIEGANRDMGTTYSLLNDIIVPNIQKDRIFVVINQADVAMKGRHWIESSFSPDSVLLDFLEEQSDSIKRRVKEATGVDILKPVYYSAEYGFNVKSVFDMIIDNMPTKRRVLMS